MIATQRLEAMLSSLERQLAAGSSPELERMRNQISRLLATRQRLKSWAPSAA